EPVPRDGRGRTVAAEGEVEEGHATARPAPPAFRGHGLEGLASLPHRRGILRQATRTWLRPPFFASYSARSARSRNACRLSTALNCVTPMETVTGTFAISPPVGIDGTENPC